MPALLPVAKLVLLAVAIVGIAGIGAYSRVVLGYYAAILVVMAVFQNTASLPGGVAILVGNAVAQIIVAVVCVLGLRHTAADAPLRRERWWLLPLMLGAWLYPFAAIVGWLGTIYGLLNMVTWFGTNPASWWMGILQVPLLIISAFLMITSWREPHSSDARVPNTRNDSFSRGLRESAYD